VEYTLLLAFIGLLAIGVVLGASGSIHGIWGTADTSLAAASTSARGDLQPLPLRPTVAAREVAVAAREVAVAAREVAEADTEVTREVAEADTDTVAGADTDLAITATKDTVSQIRSRILGRPLPNGRGSERSRTRQQAVTR